MFLYPLTHGSDLTQWAVTTSVDYSLAQLIQVIVLLSTGGKNNGGYEASKYVVIVFHGAILLVHAILNSLSISWLSLFGQFAAAWNFFGNEGSSFSFFELFFLELTFLTGCRILRCFSSYIPHPLGGNGKGQSRVCFHSFQYR